MIPSMANSISFIHSFFKYSFSDLMRNSLSCQVRVMSDNLPPTLGMFRLFGHHIKLRLQYLGTNFRTFWTKSLIIRSDSSLLFDRGSEANCWLWFGWSTQKNPKMVMANQSDYKGDEDYLTYLTDLATADHASSLVGQAFIVSARLNLITAIDRWLRFRIPSFV